MLSRPVLRRHTTCGGNGRVEYAVSAMQGYRSTMEDAHAAFEELDLPPATSFFAVYDGHGGPAVAQFCAKHLHAEVLSHPEYSTNLANAVERAFFRMDELLREKKARLELTACSGKDYYEVTGQKASFLNCFNVKRHYRGPVDEGSTACVALIRDNQIIVGNTGDSRCVLSRNGQAIALSTDHKPNNPNEAQRIEQAGSSISQSRGAYRIDDGIAVSRAIGDMRFKKKDLTPEQQALTCSPEIVSEHITVDTEFLVIACDGVCHFLNSFDGLREVQVINKTVECLTMPMDVLESQEVVNFVRARMRSDKNLGSICEDLLLRCITGQKRSMDNMTVVLVRFVRAPAPPLPAFVPGSALDDLSMDDGGRNKGKAPVVEGGASFPGRRSTDY